MSPLTPREAVAAILATPLDSRAFFAGMTAAEYRVLMEHARLANRNAMTKVASVRAENEAEHRRRIAAIEAETPESLWAGVEAAEREMKADLNKESDS